MSVYLVGFLLDSSIGYLPLFPSALLCSDCDFSQLRSIKILEQWLRYMEPLIPQGLSGSLAPSCPHFSPHILVPIVWIASGSVWCSLSPENSYGAASLTQKKSQINTKVHTWALTCSTQASTGPCNRRPSSKRTRKYLSHVAKVGSSPVYTLRRLSQGCVSNIRYMRLRIQQKSFCLSSYDRGWTLLPNIHSPLKNRPPFLAKHISPPRIQTFPAPL